MRISHCCAGGEGEGRGERIVSNSRRRGRGSKAYQLMII
jgi:hypothetical protein